MADLQLPAGEAVAVEVSARLNYRKETGQHGLNVAK